MKKPMATSSPNPNISEYYAGQLAIEANYLLNKLYNMLHVAINKDQSGRKMARCAKLQYLINKAWHRKNRRYEMWCRFETNDD